MTAERERLANVGKTVDGSIGVLIGGLAHGTYEDEGKAENYARDLNICAEKWSNTRIREALEAAEIIARDGWKNVPDGNGDASARMMDVEIQICRLKEKYT